MRRRVNLLLGLVLLFAAAGFSYRAARAGNGADLFCRGVTLYLETPLSAQDVRLAASREYASEDGGTMFTAWGELAGETVRDPDLGRSTQADVLLFYGSPALVLPQARLDPDDGKGCMIGEQTAWELFGSTKVSGDEICIGDRGYTIRGVLREPERGVVVVEGGNGIAGSRMGTAGGDAGAAESGEAGSKADAAGGGIPCYDRITIGSSKAAEGEAFLMRNALDGRLLRFDYLRSLSWLGELVPGKWSDFNGWKENYEHKKEDAMLIMQVHKNSVELGYERRCMEQAWNRVLQITCVWVAAVYLFRSAKSLGVRLL